MIIDFHCHIAPGIDDGAQIIDESLILARQCVEDGVTHVVATPHGSSSNLESMIHERDAALETLRARLEEEHMPLTILPGMEYYADGHSAASSLDKPACRCGNSPNLHEHPMLVELPPAIDLSFAANILFSAQIKNITVVLAHPERYRGFTARINDLKELMDRGLYLQFNSMDFRRSLFNWSIVRGMLKLIEHAPDRVVIGSDAHHPVYRPAGLSHAREKIISAFGEDCWKSVSWENPARLLGIQHS